MKETIYLDSDEQVRTVLGVLDENVKLLEDLYDIEVYARGRQIKLKGEKKPLADCKKVILALLMQRNQGKTLHQVIREVSAHGKKKSPEGHPAGEFSEPSANRSANFPLSEADRNFFTHCRKEVIPLTKGQRDYIQTIREYTVVFGIGPAGTGKTYLAMASAIESLKRGEVEKMILCRPAVETGERLGFLPGDLSAKINPYLRPLLDALYDLMPAEEIADYMEKGKIEIVPLAYMRGRTLNDAFIILDEAQNSTTLQMKMFLTRMGMGARMVITGDVTQIDFATPKQSGLVEAEAILKRIEGIKIFYLKEQDIVRNPLVKAILRAYEQKAKGKG